MRRVLIIAAALGLAGCSSTGQSVQTAETSIEAVTPFAVGNRIELFGLNSGQTPQYIINEDTVSRIGRQSAEPLRRNNNGTVTIIRRIETGEVFRLNLLKNGRVRSNGYLEPRLRWRAI